MRLPFSLACIVLAGLFSLAGSVSAGIAPTPAIVRIGVESEPGDRRFDFPALLLQQALARSNPALRVQRVPGMSQPRMIQSAREGQLDVLVLPSISAGDISIRHVAFPLRRGLLGVRLLLARPEDAPAIARVPSLQVLKRDYVLGYGQGWLDRRSMEDLGFRMEFASSYRGLFDMLRGRRFDYLSRGVSELHAELADPRLAGTGMVVVPGIALFKPLDDFFFVPAGRRSLHEDIERGLQAMLADGSYDRLLAEHYGEAMRAAGIEDREILHVVGYPVALGTPLEYFDILTPVRSRAVLRAPDAGR